MERDTRRRADMERQLAGTGLDYTFFTGADGKKMSMDELAKIADIPGLEQKYEKPIDLLRGLVGCTYSHFLIYEKMVKENIPVACVLEDDVILSRKFHEVLAWAEQHIQPNELISLHTLLYFDTDFQSTDRRTNDYAICTPDPPKIRGTQGYVITRQAAEWLMQFMMPIIDFPDCFNRYRLGIEGLEIKVLFPFPIRHMWIDSVRDDNRPGWVAKVINTIQNKRLFLLWNLLRWRRRAVNDRHIASLLRQDGKPVSGLYLKDMKNGLFSKF